MDFVSQIGHEILDEITKGHVAIYTKTNYEGIVYI